MKAKSKKKRALRQPASQSEKQPVKQKQTEKDVNQSLEETPAMATDEVQQVPVGGHRLKLPKKVSEVLLQELSDSKNPVANEKEERLENGDGVCRRVNDGGDSNRSGAVKRGKKLFLKPGWLLLAGCICVLICIWPSLGIERYMTKRQCARVERLVQSRDYKHGLMYLDEIKEGREGDYLYWMFRGVCNAGIEYSRQEAEQDYLRSLSLCKDQHEIYEVKYYLAVLCNEMGRYDETKAICMEALARVRKWKPGARERYEALLNRADINQETQKVQEAAQRGG